MMITAKEHGIRQGVWGSTAARTIMLAKPFGTMELLARVQVRFCAGSAATAAADTVAYTYPRALYLCPAKHIVRADGPRCGADV